MARLKRARFGASLADKKAGWAVLRESRFSNFGTTAWIAPMGDSDFDTNSVVTTAGEEQLLMTYSEDVTGFDNPPTFEGPSGIPVIDFNGTDEEADIPDNVALSTVGAFSIVVCLFLTDATSSIIVAKWDESSASELREFQCGFDSSDRPYMEVYDESENASIGRRDGTAITEGVWVHLTFTFSGGTDAADISILLNGVAVDDADVVDDAGFANAEDLATVFSLGYITGTGSSKAEFLDSKMTGGPFGLAMVLVELTADQALRDYQLFRDAIGA